ncbi:hypothetical protein KW790_00590 [Candidatus Parcubacteria bacterium]|nr:hypothetical protein [Candidatus Parcubacteria bacterium]
MQLELGQTFDDTALAKEIASQVNNRLEKKPGQEPTKVLDAVIAEWRIIDRKRRKAVKEQALTYLVERNIRNVLGRAPTHELIGKGKWHPHEPKPEICYRDLQLPNGDR